jgi:hypothetical protein
MSTVIWQGRTHAFGIIAAIIGLAAIAMAEPVTASCAAPNEGGRWWNKDPGGDPISLEVMLTKCGDQPRLAAQASGKWATAVVCVYQARIARQQAERRIETLVFAAAARDPSHTARVGITGNTGRVKGSPVSWAEGGARPGSNHVARPSVVASLAVESPPLVCVASGARERVLPPLRYPPASVR